MCLLLLQTLMWLLHCMYVYFSTLYSDILPYSLTWDMTSPIVICDSTLPLAVCSVVCHTEFLTAEVPPPW